MEDLENGHRVKEEDMSYQAGNHLLCHWSGVSGTSGEVHKPTLDPSKRGVYHPSQAFPCLKQAFEDINHITQKTL